MKVSPLMRWLVGFARRSWTFRTTRDGKLLGVGLVLATSVGVVSLDIPAYALVCGLAALAVVTSAAGWAFRPRLAVSGCFPDKAVAGRPVTGVFSLTNPSQRPAYDLCAGFFGLPKSLELVDADCVLPSLAPGATAALPVTVRPLRRGLYPLPDLRVYSTFPLNLCRVPVKPANGRHEAHADRLLVLPHFHAVSRLDVPVARRYQPGGIALSSSVGESPEYCGNREYRPGDPLRHLDHRAWARHAKPVVREFQEEYYCRIALVLDTFVPGRQRPGAHGFANLEAAVSLSASVADALARGDYILDIFAAGPELYVFRAGRHTAHLENVLEILSCVDACRENPFTLVTPALEEELATVSTVIAVFLDWDGSREDLVRAAIESGCLVKVHIVRDGETTEPFEEVAHRYGITQWSPRVIQDGGIESL